MASLTLQRTANGYTQKVNFDYTITTTDTTVTLTVSSYSHSTSAYGFSAIGYKMDGSVPQDMNSADGFVQVIGSGMGGGVTTKGMPYTKSWSRGASSTTHKLNFAGEISIAQNTSQSMSSGTVSSSITVSVPAKPTYPITYDANGGTGTTDSQTKNYNVAINLRQNGYTNPGYTFKRWNTNANDTGTGYEAGQQYTGNAALSLYAIWNRAISYDANGGSNAPAAQTGVKTDAIAITSSVPDNEGFTFDHWNTAADDSGTSYQSGGSFPANLPNTTLYAIWKHSISYNANGGSNVPTTQSALNTEAIIITSSLPTKTNYRFVKWNTKSDGTGTSYDPGDEIPAETPNMLLYAIWEYYHSPIITTFEVMRCDSEGVFSESGTCLLARVAWRISPWRTNVKPTGIMVTAMYGETEIDSMTEDEFTSTASGDDYIGTTLFVLDGPFDVTKQYDVLVEVEDILSTGNAASVLPVAFYPINFYPGGHGVGLGKPAEENKCLIGYDTEIDGTINCTSLTQTSDKRAKTHIRYLGEEAAEMIDSLEPALFMHEGKRLMGFYAQDVQKADVYESDIVQNGPGAFLSLNYTALLAPIVAYIQMLEERIVELENDYKDDKENE